MRAAGPEPGRVGRAVGYGSGDQWQQVPAPRMEVREANVRRRVDGGRNIVRYTDEIRKYGKAGQWQQALSSFGKICDEKLEPDVFSYNVVMSALGTGQQWLRAVSLLREMRDTKLEPD
ncbi:unnamed protein product [Prorocentrum cordatum]|uniref:Pentatricopeptide repeat-containing protein n=1 Tax=Prorocentrum cordatum TaxID=2364126 RepID=A0ABN9PCU6_9DINO|nr:unnamed protein product [Polarella glacialis]